MFYEIRQDIQSNKDVSQATHHLGNHDATLQNEYDDISMKTKN